MSIRSSPAKTPAPHSTLLGSRKEESSRKPKSAIKRNPKVKKARKKLGNQKKEKKTPPKTQINGVKKKKLLKKKKKLIHKNTKHQPNKPLPIPAPQITTPPPTVSACKDPSQRFPCVSISIASSGAQVESGLFYSPHLVFLDRVGGDEEDENNEDEEEEEDEEDQEKKIIVELDIIVCTAGFGG
ncbi:hypothetical protein P167DRAFT_545283 [Morchella conica CCBAS932]|uniref:Uncharacterized protein n=1 Tax=Morchella conica CCBAS932 TaxID=1392247 RepID=A0A3N4KQC2_9PEZI|nr:hypothetical protein P167DRAFT_545283 [Morchella conica CCBAS932]